MITCCVTHSQPGIFLHISSVGEVFSFEYRFSFPFLKGCFEILKMPSFPELYFNVDNGYLEGLVRGFKAGILTQGDYLNLVQCETLEGKPAS